MVCPLRLVLRPGRGSDRKPLAPLGLLRIDGGLESRWAGLAPSRGFESHPLGFPTPVRISAARQRPLETACRLRARRWRPKEVR